MRPDVVVADNVVAFPALLTGGAPYVRIMSCSRSVVTREFPLTDVFVAAQIATPLEIATTVDIEASTQAARATLDDGRFDYAPVTQGSRTLGWVSAATLKEASRVDASLTPLDRCTIIAADASVGEVIQRLAGQPFVFLVGERGVQSFVVPSDLGRHPC